MDFITGVSRSGGDFVRPEAITLQPYGRYCNGSKFAGEVDFWEALADVKRRFPIDEDRIVIRGFSLGGHSAWHLGAHHAWQWAAVAPGAGFSESREFLTQFEKDPLSPSWWEEKLWQLYDAPPYAENFRNVPVVAYSGEKDRQKQAADVMEKALARVGMQLVHVIGPGTEHSYHPAAKAEINRLIDALADKGREAVPRRVSLVTPTLKYNRQAWVQADALDEHWTRGPDRRRAERRGDALPAHPAAHPQRRGPEPPAAERPGPLLPGSGREGRDRRPAAVRADGGLGSLVDGRAFTRPAAAGGRASSPGRACASATICRGRSTMPSWAASCSSRPRESRTPGRWANGSTPSRCAR